MLTRQALLLLNFLLNFLLFRQMFRHQFQSNKTILSFKHNTHNNSLMNAATFYFLVVNQKLNVFTIGNNKQQKHNILILTHILITHLQVAWINFQTAKTIKRIVEEFMQQCYQPCTDQRFQDIKAKGSLFANDP